MAKSNRPADVPAGAQPIAVNRRARRDYEVLTTVEMGLVLQGSEVKSLREAKVQLAESWARVDDGEIWLHNLHISPYSSAAGAFVPDPLRVRKLLAHRYEISRLAERVQREALTLIPLALYFKSGRAKVNLALARGKTRTDRRQDIARRDANREAARAMAIRGRRVDSKGRPR